MKFSKYLVEFIWHHNQNILQVIGTVLLHCNSNKSVILAGFVVILLHQRMNNEWTNSSTFSFLSEEAPQWPLYLLRIAKDLWALCFDIDIFAPYMGNLSGNHVKKADSNAEEL